MLTELEKKIIACVQGDIPISRHPYREMAENLGIDEETLLCVLNALHEKGYIRRFGATLRHQKSGFGANAMVAWMVEEDRIEEVGDKMAASPHVTHCYQRLSHEKWPYNLYTMVHAPDEKTCREIAETLSGITSVKTYRLLFSREELKKTSMKYFPGGCI